MPELGFLGGSEFAVSKISLQALKAAGRRVSTQGSNGPWQKFESARGEAVS
jgi:hypothetical protein